jgi:hypothetical protein
MPTYDFMPHAHFWFRRFPYNFFSLSIVSVRLCCFRCHLSSSLICHRRPWINVFLCLFFHYSYLVSNCPPFVFRPDPISCLLSYWRSSRELSPRLLALFLRSREVSAWHWLCVRDQALGRRLPGGEEYPPPPSDVSHGFSRFLENNVFQICKFHVWGFLGFFVLSHAHRGEFQIWFSCFSTYLKLINIKYFNREICKGIVRIHTKRKNKQHTHCGLKCVFLKE